MDLELLFLDEEVEWVDLELLFLYGQLEEVGLWTLLLDGMEQVLCSPLLLLCCLL